MNVLKFMFLLNSTRIAFTINLKKICHNKLFNFIYYVM